MSINEHIPGNK